MKLNSVQCGENNFGGKMKTYNLFISHSWHYYELYIQLNDLLRGAPYFDYKDYSVPFSDPLIIRNQRYYESELQNKIESQMKSCSAVLVLAGVFSTYSDSIRMEIEIAKRLGKPIIAVEPFGAERTSAYVKKEADRIVKWNTNSIVGAIKELCI